MAWKSHESQSRDLSWGVEGRSPTLEELQYGASARIATALETLNCILREESGWCQIRKAIKKIAEGRVRVRYELAIKISIRWPWGKKRKK
jgi:hypothetical protein